MTDAPHGEAEHLLDPPLPYHMRPRAERAVRDVQLQQFVNRATELKYDGRVRACAEAFGERYDDLRAHAGAIRQHALDHLDVYLDQFVEAAQRQGMQVHFARDAEQAQHICLDLAAKHNVKQCVKSKSMVTEEIHLLRTLTQAGIETIETDLGEFIVQLDGDAPSHIVTPMIHKDRTSVARAFQRELKAEYTEEPHELTMIAREHMRTKFRSAELGVSGANFLLADSGTIVICTNEGNADLAVSCPPVHIAVVGMEKVVPSAAHLSPLLKLLARSATAQDLTVYTTMIHGPRRPDEHDGPEHVHVVLLDNGRSNLLTESTRELLRCIRCGACLNACPVYRRLGGGHAYGAVYSGPIGATITPHLKGVHNYVDLPQASSLCGACRDACPVHIDLPGQLVALREQIAQRRLNGFADRILMTLWAHALRSPRRFRAAQTVLRWIGRLAARRDDRGSRWLRRLPGPLRGWTTQRDFPAPAAQSFRQWWAQRERERNRP